MCLCIEGRLAAYVRARGGGGGEQHNSYKVNEILINKTIDYDEVVMGPILHSCTLPFPLTFSLFHFLFSAFIGKFTAK